MASVSSTDQDIAVLLFLLPTDEKEAEKAQDTFLTDTEFWASWRLNLTAWTDTLGVTRTESPDGKPALALLLKPSPIDTLFYEVGESMAESLGCPAYNLLYTQLEPEALAELQTAPRPW